MHHHVAFKSTLESEILTTVGACEGIVSCVLHFMSGSLGWGEKPLLTILALVCSPSVSLFVITPAALIPKGLLTMSALVNQLVRVHLVSVGVPERLIVEG